MKNQHPLLKIGIISLLLVSVSTPFTAQNWNQIIKAAASDRAANYYFGTCVAISGDYAIVGAPNDGEDAVGVNTKTEAGSAYIFKRTGTNWVQEAKIVASDRAANDHFGSCVAINGDYAIIGAPEEDEDAAGLNTKTNAGSAYIFKRTGTTWVQETKIVVQDRVAFDLFGITVAISTDYVIVGAIYKDDDGVGGNRLADVGFAYIFKRTGTTWAQEAKIVASDRAAFDYFGASVAISDEYAIVGAWGEDENEAGANTKTDAGSAYIFKRTGTTWAQEAKIVASDRAADDRFGTSVAISGDFAIIAAPFEDEDMAGVNTKTDAGSAYIFKRTGTTWVQEAKIVASDRAAEDGFGVSVAINGDFAIIAAPFEDEDMAGVNTKTEAGSAYIFKRTGTTWVQETKIIASDRAAGDVFGWSVAISGDYAIVGAWFEDEDAAGANTKTDAGSVYFFKRTLPNALQSINKEQYKLIAYPSVSTGILNIEMADVIAKNETMPYQIFNLLGQQVLHGKTAQQIDVSALPQGTYVVKVGEEQAQFVKQ